MPEYLYKCKNPECRDFGKYFVIVHKMTDVVKAHCPTCKGEKLARKFTSTEPIFNGLGWGKEKRA